MIRNSLMLIILFGVLGHEIYAQDFQRKVGRKYYETSNHLGNVTTVVGDRRIHQAISGGATIAVADPNIITTNDYYPYGMLLEGRGGSVDYRFGFQGQEQDDEVKGGGNTVNYTYRMHDVRLGRFFAVDPLSNVYPFNTPFAFSENHVIAYRELEGLEKYYAADGSYLGSWGEGTTIRVVMDSDVESFKKDLKEAQDHPNDHNSTDPLNFYWKSQAVGSKALASVDRTIANKVLTSIYHSKVNPNGYEITAWDIENSTSLGSTNPLTRGISIAYKHAAIRNVNNLISVLYHEDIHSRETGLASQYTSVAEVLAYQGMFGNKRTWQPTTEDFKLARRKVFMSELNNLNDLIKEKIRVRQEMGAEGYDSELRQLIEIKKSAISTYETSFNVELGTKADKLVDSSLEE